MRHALATIPALLAALPASAHGLHAGPVDGHAHGPLVAALVALPIAALLILFIAHKFRR